MCDDPQTPFFERMEPGLEHLLREESSSEAFEAQIVSMEEHVNFDGPDEDALETCANFLESLNDCEAAQNDWDVSCDEIFIAVGAQGAGCDDLGQCAGPLQCNID
ncbi:MAG: hypothetical protein GY822_01410 [Deltaproteobacteria bacterium]|nr:hypothetical protein [Deltaproteobacteria bacterium]